MSLGVKPSPIVMIDFLLRDNEFTSDLPSPRCNFYRI